MKQPKEKGALTRALKSLKEGQHIDLYATQSAPYIRANELGMKIGTNILQRHTDGYNLVRIFNLGDKFKLVRQLVAVEIK